MCIRSRLAAASQNKSDWHRQLHERIAETVVSETPHLNAEIRGHIDQKLNTAGMTRMGFKAAAACIRKAAYEADREGYVQRGRTERKHRRVGSGRHPTPWRS
jgi:hypothetical protein